MPDLACASCLLPSSPSFSPSLLLLWKMIGRTPKIPPAYDAAVGERCRILRGVSIILREKIALDALVVAEVSRASAALPIEPRRDSLRVELDIQRKNLQRLLGRKAPFLPRALGENERRDALAQPLVALRPDETVPLAELGVRIDQPMQVRCKAWSVANLPEMSDIQRFRAKRHQAIDRGVQRHRIELHWARSRKRELPCVDIKLPIREA